MIPIIGEIVNGIVGLGKTIGGGVLERAKIKAQGKIDIKKAKIEMQVNRYKQLGEMDLAAMQGMQFSWKDEYLTILISIPAVMCFIPDFTIMGITFSPATTVSLGFGTLKTMPEWYQWAFTGVIAAVFGLRTWLGFKK